MSFDPRQDYQITQDIVQLRDFHDYREAYITRPPYQRKNVWSEKKKQALLDSLVRRYYVPKLVFRLVRLSDDRAVNEVIDGQQRITAVQEFFQDELRLPTSLRDLSSDLAGKTYEQLPVEMKQFVARLSFSVDRITNIENPRDPSHQRVATEIFWRLQQGESLNEMEKAHARLSSLVRNFLVKYADDITFDYGRYVPVDENPDKHPFFKIIERKNERMQHLGLLARMLLVEKSGGPTDVRDEAIIDLIDETQISDGIGNNSYENEQVSKSVIGTISLFHGLFKDDPMLKKGGTIKELNREYFILSFFMLLRHLRKYYAIDEKVKMHLREFFDAFYARWSANTREEDRDIVHFSENRQQSANDLRERDLIVRQLFFDFLREKKMDLFPKDSKRAFNEAERIAIYRRGKGICLVCNTDRKSDEDSTIPWAEYEADHVLPHAHGGQTVISNAQLLCRYHNRSKGADRDS